MLGEDDGWSTVLVTYFHLLYTVENKSIQY